MIYSVYKGLFDYSIFKHTTQVLSFSFKYHLFMIYFVHKWLLWLILLIYLSFRLSYRVIGLHVHAPPVTLLYIFLLLVTYSIHEEYFDGITLHELVFAQVWLILLIYFSLVNSSLHILWLHVHIPLVTYSLHISPLSELFLYIFILLVTYSVHYEVLTAYSVHIPPHFDLNSMYHFFMT